MLDGDIPIVGRAFTVLCAYSTAIIQCECDAKCVLSLHGKLRPAVCPGCGKVYAISKSGETTIGQVINPRGENGATG